MEPPLEPPDELEPPDGAVEDDGALAAIGVSFFPHPTAKKQHTTEAINNHGRNMAVSNKFQKFNRRHRPDSPSLFTVAPQMSTSPRPFHAVQFKNHRKFSIKHIV